MAGTKTASWSFRDLWFVQKLLPNPWISAVRLLIRFRSSRRFKTIHNEWDDSHAGKLGEALFVLLRTSIMIMLSLFTQDSYFRWRQERVFQFFVLFLLGLEGGRVEDLRPVFLSLLLS